MLKAKARWKIEQSDDRKVSELTKQLQLSPLVAQLLINRGIETVQAAKRFLYKEKVDVYDPFLLDGMRESVERIERALEANEKILIFGDYDADGVSSTTIMYYTLREKQADFDFYIPNRFTEGYGPNEPALRWAKEQGYGLVVTVDTGISAVKEAAVAKELGLDFIVTDHHEPPPELPDAYCIINPKKPGCPYPFKELAGVGVAFKLAHALLGRVPTEWLDIVAIGTIADLVPLVDENRLLAKLGVEALQVSQKPGIKAIKKVCGIDQQVINAEHVGFGIGPRINAVGRLDSADPAVHLLISEDQEEADAIAEDIDQLNQDRKEIVNQMAEEAIAEVEANYPPDQHSVLIIARENWNPGVIGIVASRLVERYYRPTIVLSIDREKGEAKGSARSIEGFDMFSNLSKSRDLLPHFGGHPMAAGLTMAIEDIDELRNRLNKQAEETLTSEDFIPLTSVDLVTTLDSISIEVIEQMEQLAPFGVSNPTPKVMIENVALSHIRKIGSEKNHLKVTFAEHDATLDGVGFHQGHLFDEISPTAKVSAIGKLSINEWNGHCKPQFMLEDVAVNEWQLFDFRGVQKLAEKLQDLPREKLLLVAFRGETVEQLDLASYREEVIAIEEAPTPIDFTDRYVFFLDLPYEMEQLNQLFVTAGQPERIYTVFHHQEDHFFTTNPTREHFKWYYAFLKKQKTFDLKTQGDQLAKYKGWSKDTVDFMTKVFFELEFVTIKDGLITLIEQPLKKDLVASKTYRRKQSQAHLENEFVYSSYDVLKGWFDNVMNEQSKIKETIN
ncbi:single-stranded-DNA-specific exonuclease RecJ [Desertibacillus haloalkaliphilus]|uniref:single-stranded-DNA-specific exonuclease RecJ n=1 Tax=Desertibacillus haloalkaliphilus TaxID=1328930 RepID=UPI001C254256|nr:single-stranded-DNA-specific exonuclease RecJ [Desertibacillus haloalkaliphilus]MBU8905511.1 single-stranded-DNA-specific exonuclease RecJ [Desertibacillus haloalkaliphilus]